MFLLMGRCRCKHVHICVYPDMLRLTFRLSPTEHHHLADTSKYSKFAQKPTPRACRATSPMRSKADQSARARAQTYVNRSNTWPIRPPTQPSFRKRPGLRHIEARNSWVSNRLRLLAALNTPLQDDGCQDMHSSGHVAGKRAELMYGPTPQLLLHKSSRPPVDRRTSERAPSRNTSVYESILVCECWGRHLADAAKHGNCDEEPPRPRKGKCGNNSGRLKPCVLPIVCLVGECPSSSAPMHRKEQHYTIIQWKAEAGAIGASSPQYAVVGEQSSPCVATMLTGVLLSGLCWTRLGADATQV